MKKIFLSLLAVASLGAQAQYSQWTYGNPASSSKEVAYNGKSLKYTDPGHIMAGVASDATVKNLYVVKNDLSGSALGAGYFNTNFSLTDANNDVYEVESAKVTELMNGNGYSIGGVVKDINGTYQLFYMRLDPNGGIAAGPVAYSLGFNPALMEFGNIRETVGGGELYLVGGLYTGGGYGPNDWNYFIHKIDENGNIQWSNVYTIYGPSTVNSVRAYDVTENASGNELAVIGTIDEVSIDGFFTKIDPSNGNPLMYYVNIYGLTTTNDYWYSIAYSNSDPNGDPRYLVAGMSNEPGNLDTWVTLLDQNGAVVWSVLTDDNSQLDNGAGEVIERKNTLGDLEYYTVGATRGGAFGGIDVHMVKGDVTTGNPLLHYAYGGSADDVGYSIDYNNSSSGTGLAMFGSTKSFVALGGTQKVYFIKSYFNGEVGCNAASMSFKYKNVLDYREIYDMNVWDHLTDYSMGVTSFDGDEDQLCFDNTLPSGSNDLVAPTNKAHNVQGTKGSVAVKLSPNPATQGSSTLNVELDAPQGTTVTVVVADMLGRSYVNQQFVLQNSGPQVLPLLLQNANLTPGMYVVKVTGLDEPTNTVLLIK